MLPDLEQMILDLEGRGWYIDECYWANDVQMYELKMKNYDLVGRNSTGVKFLVEKLTFSGAITEAWRQCR